jgi:hypothetical protein
LRIEFALINAGVEVPLAGIVRARRRRHRTEEVFEVGVDHYEVRNWVGWHRITLSLVPLWFPCLERREVGEKPGDHRAAGEAHPGRVAPRSATELGRDRPRGDAGAAA